MISTRRRFLLLAAGAAALSAIPQAARAQAYPARPIHLIVPFAPAGAADIIARIIGPALSERLGQQVVIENKAGAGGNIGTELTVRSPGDGYTLLMIGGFNAINTTLYDKLSFVFSRDIAPVASIARMPNVMEVNPAFPAKTVPEFIAYAKANPDKINFASGGTGSPTHMVGELFKMMTGIKMVHLPYRGAGPALIDLLGGQVEVMFATLPSSIGHIRGGKLHPLAVTFATRSGTLPDVPTIGEFVPGYDAGDWYGVGAPKDTPPEVIDRLNRDINAVLTDPKMQARLIDLGMTPQISAKPSDYAAFIADETEKWAKVIKFSGAKVE
ncbi:MAG: tripartite tricarboxylate transporter substrate binding protein [Hyphomicrobiales bacterium]